MLDPVDRLRDALDALERAYSPGHHGRWSAERRSDLVDRCLEELWERAGPPGGAALCAVGGYGRRRQLPASDVDLLVVHEGLDAAGLERIAEAVLYPLWDGGFTLGQAFRTPAEVVEAARAHLEALTSMLDARVVAGDAALAARALQPVRRLVVEDPGAFVGRLRSDAAARRERFGTASHDLEPDLKEGGGGLRDAALVGWVVGALEGSAQAGPILRPREREALEEAEDVVLRARSALHLLTGKRTDRLHADLQPRVAAAMGFVDGPDADAADALMRAVYERARQIEHVRDLVLDRAAGRADDRPSVPLGAAGVLEHLAALAEAGRAPSAGTLDAIEDAGVPAPVAWDAEVWGAFARLLRTGEVRAFDTLDRLGLLVRYLPAWADVRCRPQRDPFHRSTVDAHLLGTWSRMAQILRGRLDPEDPIESEAAAAVTDPEALLLGALLHDIGKVGRGDHVPIGAAIARATLERIGAPPATQDLAVFLVTEHLLLPDTATRRDLTEENPILDVAARVATPDRLFALYLLTKADAAATGPAAWTPWRRALIHELVLKVRHVLERGEMGEELAARLAERIERVREGLAGHFEADVDRFVLRMPRGYFLAVEPERAVRHAQAILPPIAADEVRSRVEVGTKPGTAELLVVAVDRPGLLSQIAGALAVNGISILTAQVFTTDDGVAVDLFEVEGAFEPDIDPARWRAFRSTLRRAIRGAISLEHRVEEVRARYPAPRVATPVTVRTDVGASDFSTVIEVGAPDRIGLLYDITRTLADLHLDVHVARVATYDGRVVDAFYVRDALGRKILDPEQLGEVERALRERLEGAGPGVGRPGGS